MNFGRPLGNLNESHGGFCHLFGDPAQSRNPAERTWGKQAPRRKPLEPMTRVLVGNPEHLRDLVSRHQGPVMFHILQNVRRASLWETRREVVDDRLERLRGEDLTFDDLASIAVSDEEGEEVHPA